jgi:hypothetical protein
VMGLLIKKRLAKTRAKSSLSVERTVLDGKGFKVARTLTTRLECSGVYSKGWNQESIYK